MVFYTLGDFASTYLALEAGGFERNPLPRFIIQRFGFAAFFLAKLAEGVFIVGVCVLLDVEAEQPSVTRGWPWLQAVGPKLAVLVAFLYAYFGLYLTVHNTLNFVSLSAA